MSSTAPRTAEPDRLWSVDEHLDDILATVRPLDPIELNLLDAQGCVLVEDITVPVSLPPSTTARWTATRCGSPTSRPARARSTRPRSRSSATSRAGAADPLHVGPGQAARIMTGAPLPPGAETVVPVEWTDGGLGEGPASGMRARSLAPEGATGLVSVYRPAPARAHVRAQGSDVRAGDRVLEA